MKKKLSFLLVALLGVVGISMATFRAGTTETLYSWESPDGTPVESGGKAAYVNGVEPNRLNYPNGDYYTMCLNGKKGNINDATASVNAGAIQITLDKPLAAGDKISITGYINKNATGKAASAYILYSNDANQTSENFGDEANIDPVANGAITTKEVIVSAEAAGSTSFKMTRSKADTNLFITKLTITREVEEEAPAATYTVAGNNTDLFGTEWDPANTANDMTLSEGVYSWSKTDVTLPAGTVAFKVCENHDWNPAYPDQNYELNIAESGIYTISITFDPATKAVNATATKTGNAEVSVDYFLVGSFNNWAQKDENYKLVKNEESEVEEYSITLDLEANTEFKVISSTSTWYPDGMDNNLSVPAAGNYTIYFRPVVNEAWGGNIYVQANSTEQLNTYTAKFENNGNWAEVYAYTYSKDGEDNVTAQELGTWPGKKIEATDEGYIVTIEAAAAPQFIIFNNGVEGEGAVQTEDLAFEDGKTYKYEAPAPIGENDIVINADDINEGDITAALTAAVEGKETVGNIFINLSEGVGYKVTSSIVVPNSLTINGNGATIDASRIEGDNKQFIVLNGTTEYVTKPDNTKDEAHLYIEKVDINNVTITGMPDGIIRDNQKTLLKNLTIDNCNIQVPNKVFVNFTSKGYVETLAVTNSTIWSADNGQFFVQYGSRLKNIAGAEAAGWLQTIDVENSTFYHIANGKNICDFPMNSQTCNVYTLKNNVFVDCGKSAGQVVVGFNKGGTSPNPVWTVSNNLFNYDGVDTSASEVSKAGKKNDTDIVQKSVAGVITFTDAAAGEFNALVTLSAGGPNYGLGDSRWTITFGPDPVALANPEKLYIMGSCVKDWSAEDRLQEMTYDEEKGVFTYELVDMDNTIFFTIGDVASFTDWLDFNFWHRYAYERQESHEQKGIIGEATQLYTTRGEGTINLPAGDWIISISKADGKMTITPKPVVISSMAIVGDLTGGWPNGDDWSMAKAMTQDAENSAIWTLTVNDVEVEAKTYYYKATANGKWGDYELPSQGNNEFIFGTEEYPAGKYNLTFVANTEQNTLTLTAERVSNPDGISSVKTVDLNDAPVFNLNGQRVNKAQKGLFIVGGKKVVIK